MSAKSKLNSKETLISVALLDSNVRRDEFFLINNVLKEYNKMKEKSLSKLKSLSKILVYSQNNVSILLEV